MSTEYQHKENAVKNTLFLSNVLSMWLLTKDY